jgi:prevent-host-death family protein
MITVDVQAAKAQLSHLVDEIAAGREVIIAKAGKPIAKLVPLTATVRRERELGHLRAGRIPAAFDAPLGDDLLDSFEGR